MSCQACRLSKVKCEQQASGSCARCARLGLACHFKPSNRGKHNVRRDVARLGPAVRALLKSTAEAGGEGSRAIEAEMQGTMVEGVDKCILNWRGHDCQLMMVEAIGARDGQIALIKHWLLIGVRSGNCALLGNVLILASKCGLKLEDVTMQIDRTIMQPSLTLPGFIQEWFDQPNRMCCVRGQREGSVMWRVNDAFTNGVGDEDFLRDKLMREHPSALTNPDFLVCTAEIFVATPFYPDDRMRLVEVNSALWRQVGSSHRPRDAASTNASLHLPAIGFAATFRSYFSCHR